LSEPKDNNGVLGRLKSLLGLKPSEPARPNASVDVSRRLRLDAKPAPTSPVDPPPPSGATGDPAAEIVAWSQAQARKSDAAHKARIRAHVERPVPPATEADRRSIGLAERSCLAIRHVYPPQHPQRSMSFLGGLPLAPDGFDYPMIHNREGLLEPLTFMAQIDLATLPEGGGRALLPKQGYLYFFAPTPGNFDASANHFVVRYVADRVKKNWGPQWTGILGPAGGAAEARYRFPWMNWHDRPEKSYPTSYPRIEVVLGWLDDVGEVEEGDSDAADGFPWEVAKQRRRAALIVFHGTPVAYDDVLSAAGKPVDQLWIPFEGFPTNRRAGEIVLGFLKSYLKEEVEAIRARIASLPAAAPVVDPQTDGPSERERLEALLAEHRQFELRHWRAMQYLTAGGDYRKPLSEDAKALIINLLEEVRAGALPPAFIERRHLQHRLPQVLNHWISVAAVESVESALQDKDQAHQIPPRIVETVRYRHSVLKDPGFSSDGDHAQHQMLGRGRLIQTAADEMAQEHILLLQLSPDQALGWDMGDYGALQYWIRPADLAALRFENTILTFECH
jgi:uncharacterized protein YwqG